MKKGKPMEKLVEFIECEAITGSAICDEIIHFLVSNN